MTAQIIPMVRAPRQTPEVVRLRFSKSEWRELTVVVEDYRTADILTTGTPKNVGEWLNHNGYTHAIGSAAIWIKDWRKKR